MIFQGNSPQVTPQTRSIGDIKSFFIARVMNPAEVRAAVGTQPSQVQSAIASSYFLCGDVKFELFAMLKAGVRESPAVRLTAFVTPAGATYAVLSHQLYGWAHRFLLPLYEPSVQAMLAGLQMTELGFSFGNEGGRDAVLLKSPLVGRDFAPLLVKANNIPKEKFLEVFDELPALISAVNSHKLIPTLRSTEAVTDVSVSVVLPTQALMGFYSKSASETE